MKNLPLFFLTLPALVCPAMAESAFPWESQVPADMLPDYVQADAVVDEEPCDWRGAVGALFRPVVQDCATAREAVLKIAANMSQITGTYYSIERRKANMNALEALAEKKISCTGQSILMVCAFRSVGIPARVVMLPTWNHVQGNHTWCEAWFEGEWHMIEFNERDFNTPWVMEGVGMLNPAFPEQHIYAIRNINKMLVEDVTPRYLQLAAEWYNKQGLPPDTQRLMVDVHPRSADPAKAELLNEQGEVVQAVDLPGPKADVRQFATLNLPREGRFSLRLPHGTFPVKATPTPAQVLIFQPDLH